MCPIPHPREEIAFPPVNMQGSQSLLWPDTNMSSWVPLNLHLNIEDAFFLKLGSWLLWIQPKAGCLRLHKISLKYFLDCFLGGGVPRTKIPGGYPGPGGVGRSRPDSLPQEGLKKIRLWCPYVFPMRQFWQQKVSQFTNRCHHSIGCLRGIGTGVVAVRKTKCGTAIVSGGHSFPKKWERIPRNYWWEVVLLNLHNAVGDKILPVVILLWVLLCTYHCGGFYNFAHYL